MKATIISSMACLCFILTQSFAPNDKAVLKPTLSAYHIFEGAYSNLKPAQDFISYELATPLFSDYAEKQRLVKVPNGKVVIPVGNGLPNFPEGTMLVKTFYYYTHKRDTSKGKRIIETRLMILSGGEWISGTYVWNANQTDAQLTLSEHIVPVNYVREDGSTASISYKIPGSSDCAKCHNADKRFIPIGFKIRNLNFNVNGSSQLLHFQQAGIMPSFNPAASYTALPSWTDTAYTLEQRARAYMDVNCAHCHSRDGYCAKANFDLAYEIPTGNTKIAQKRKRLLNMLEQHRMPQIGTTMLHHEGVALIKEYVNSLQ